MHGICFRVSREIVRRLAIRERLRLAKDELLSPHRKVKDLPRVFNLDLHISVIWDLRVGMSGFLDLVSWSASGHNRIPRPKLPNPDPVAVVNQKSWLRLTPSLARRFRLRYRRFLASFEGFVVTYPPAFLTLFLGLGRPILAVAATRFDWPLSRDEALLSWFVGETRRALDSGQLTLVSNNLADAEFAEFSLQRRVPVVPSLCDYVLESGYVPIDGADSGYGPVFLGGSRFSQEFCGFLKGVGINDMSILYPEGYNWMDFYEVAYVFIVPYNVSTMTLFELATLGVPVVIPDDAWLREMALAKENGALSELLFPGAVVNRAFDEKIRQQSRDPSGLTWWLDRADFSDANLMPNVSRVSRGDLNQGFHPKPVSREVVEIRNAKLRATRATLLSDFAEKCKPT